MLLADLIHLQSPVFNHLLIQLSPVSPYLASCRLVYVALNVFVGGKMVDGDQTRLELEARLIESENKIRHYESIMRNRDQELNMTKKVSRIMAVTQSCVSQSIRQSIKPILT